MEKRRAARLIAALIVAMGSLAAAGTPAHAGQVGVTVSIQGSGSTEVVEGSIEDGQTGSCNWTSNKDDRVSNSCPRFRNEEAFEAWVWLRATPSNTPSGHWRFARWEGCDETRERDGFTECAVRSPWDSAVEKTPKAVFDDFVSPTVSAVTESFSLTSERTVTYTFSTSEGVTKCRFDGEPETDCTSGVQRTYATEGSKVIEVRAVDASGNSSGISTRTVTVIDTALTSGPSGLTNSRTVSFGYSTGAGTGFDCSLDGAPFTDCGLGTSKTYSNLQDGAHTFRVRAKDGSWFDRIPAQRTWTIDATAPDTFLQNHAGTPGEGSLSTLTTATFAFTANEGSTFQCKLDGAEFAACSSPHTVSGLAPGQHTFQVRATDAAGNVDGSPVQRIWTVAQPDADEDGYDAGVDCDDGNADINPGEPEILDNDVDENCDGVKGVNLDRDGDGSNRPADCDDGNAAISPSRPEVLDNDVDENCDGVKGENLDRDGDGVQRPADCDDGSPAIRPGAVELAGNGIDDDCRDGDAPLPPPAKEVVDVLLTHAYKARRAHTTFSKLTVTRVPAGATVVARCKIGRKACAGKARKAFRRTNASGNVSLRAFLRQRLKPRSVITITVTKPGATGSVTIVTIRRGKAPRGVVRCLPPGAKAPVAC